MARDERTKRVWWLGEGWPQLLEVRRDYKRRQGVGPVGAKNWLAFLQSLDPTELSPYRKRVIREFKADLVALIMERS